MCLISYTISQFLLLQKVGEGDRGYVFKAKRIDDHFICAIKVLRDIVPNPNSTNAVLNELGVPKEAEMLHGLSSPHIVKCFGWGNLEKKDLNFDCEMKEQSVFVVLEWIDGLTLGASMNNPLFKPDIKKIIFKQLLNTVTYLHEMKVYHGSIFLNNIMITHKVNENGQRTPHLILIDFGDSDYIKIEGAKDWYCFGKDKLDKWQCGGVLLSLFSSTNTKNNQISTKFLPKEVSFWVCELMDCMKVVCLQDVINSPFFEHNETLPFSRKSSLSSIQGLDDHIIENILGHLIDSGNLCDLFNVQLVCTHFYNVIQRIFLFYKKFPHIEQHDFPKDLADLNKIKETISLPQNDFLLFIKNIQSLYISYDVEILHDYSDKDKEFEKLLVASYLGGVQTDIAKLEDILPTLKDWQSWNGVFSHLHSIYGASNYVGYKKLSWLAYYARQRAKRNTNDDVKKKFSPFEFEGERKLFFVIVEEIKKCMLEFSLNINIHLTL